MISNAARRNLLNAENRLNNFTNTCRELHRQLLEYLTVYYEEDDERIALYNKDVHSEGYIEKVKAMKEGLKTDASPGKLKNLNRLLHDETTFMEKQKFALKKVISEISTEVTIMKALAEEQVERELQEVRVGAVRVMIKKHHSLESGK